MPAVPAAPALSPKMRLTLALGSMGIAVFATAAAGDFTGLPGVVVVWAGVVLVNVAAAFSPPARADRAGQRSQGDHSGGAGLPGAVVGVCEIVGCW